MVGVMEDEIEDEMEEHADSSRSAVSSPSHSEQMDNYLLIDVERIIKDSQDSLWLSTCSIYRVPYVIRHLKEEAYTPKVISIGPFHYDNERLRDMVSHKHILFKKFTEEALTSLEELVNFAKYSEPKVRASYSDEVNHYEEELARMILVDAGFIIQLLRMYSEKRLKNSRLSKPWLFNAIIMDLLLLENQLPFFFLEDLFNKAFPLDLRGDAPSFLKLTFGFFKYFNRQELEPDPNVKLNHFTDLLRFFHLQRTKPPRCRYDGDCMLSYSANELQEAGLKFKAIPSKCLLDLKLIGCTLEVPKIVMQDRYEILFRNMIALEQFHYPHHSYITDYTHVLDCLINTSKDVDVLIDRGIIHNNGVETSDTAKIFNGFDRNIIRSNFNSNYSDICKRLNGFYQNPWHKKKATLRRDYCKTPWQTAASIAAIVLLILSLVQTIFSIL